MRCSAAPANGRGARLADVFVNKRGLDVTGSKSDRTADAEERLLLLLPPLLPLRRLCIWSLMDMRPVDWASSSMLPEWEVVSLLADTSCIMATSRLPMWCSTLAIMGGEELCGEALPPAVAVAVAASPLAADETRSDPEMRGPLLSLISELTRRW